MGCTTPAGDSWRDGGKPHSRLAPRPGPTNDNRTERRMGIWSAETPNKATAQTKASLKAKYAKAEASDKSQAAAGKAAGRGGRRV